MSNELKNNSAPLFNEIKQLIEAARIRVKATVNSELIILYWNIGKHINQFI